MTPAHVCADAGEAEREDLERGGILASESREADERAQSCNMWRRAERGGGQGRGL